ncbi:uncharacterized protein [Macrobrachium rosenbergii]|uniref:uncharacterized protein n=1 Tax=Macrobrachium rosenbergii TaxID=79674 RepID=UPI0034D6AAA5
MQRKDQMGETKDSRVREVSISSFLFFFIFFLEVSVLGTIGLPNGLTALHEDSRHNTHNYLLGEQDSYILKNAAREFNARAEVTDETIADDQDDLTMEALALSVNGKGGNVEILGHFDIPEDTLEQFAICFWIKPTCWSEYGTFFNSASLWISLQRGNITVSIPGRFTVFNAIVELRLWNHVCISVQGTDMQLFHDGQLAEPSYVQDYNEIPPKLLASRFVNITSHYMDGASTFCGYLASLQILQGLLSMDQINFVRLRNFTEVPFPRYLYVIDVIPNKKKIITSCALKEIFKKKHNFSILMFRERINYSHALVMCTGYGGTLPVLEDVEHMEMIAEYLLNIQDIGDTWMQMSYSKVSRNLELPWCPLLYKRKGVSFVIQWDCMNFSLNLMCLIPKGLFLKLKGHALTNDNEFAIQQDKTFERITLESRRNLQGLWKGSAFQVQTRNGEVQFQVKPEGDHPIGRRDWLTKDNNTITLSLSTCSPEEFSCSNGQCIPIDQRCDGNKGDCFDLSDDDSSCDIFLGPDRTYYELQAPRDRRVSVDLWMKYIRSIDVNENIIKVLFQVTLRWRDERLQFYNLGDHDKVKNMLDIKSLETLWYPTLYISTATFEGNLRINSNDMIFKLTIIPQKNGSLTLIESFEAKEYDGKDVIIEMIKALDISVQCNFNFQAFPFDFQLCLIPILLQGNDHPLIDEETLKVRSDNQSLPIYHVSAIRCRVASTGLRYDRDQVVVAVLIDRKSEAFFLTMLGPCIVLEMLGHLSFLAFPIDEFYQRASTSLSLLIVVASLFSQSVSNLPKSASPKAIDVWFFYFILRFFLFFVAHCLVEFQRFRVQKKENGNNVQILKFSNEKTNWNGKLKSHPLESTCSSLDADECQDGQGQRKAHRRLGWTVTETSKTPPFQPETINLVCLLLGVAIDATFIALFIHFLGKIRSNIYDEFLKYKDCS